jgi:hypothetical protein
MCSQEMCISEKLLEATTTIANQQVFGTKVVNWFAQYKASDAITFTVGANNWCLPDADAAFGG